MENLWIMSIQACPLILAVLLVRLPLQKYPKVYSYSLWILVLARLLCPVFIESPFSLQMDLRQYLAEQQAEEGQQDTETAGKFFDDAEVFPGEKEVSRLADTEEQTLDRQRDFHAENAGRLLRMLYLAGVMGTAGVLAFQYVQMHRRVAFAVLDRDNIWLCEGIASPFVMGLFRPRIYLPFDLSENEKIYIVWHEGMHIRHGDPWMRSVGLTAICLHWWNPLVWYAVHKMFQDMEMYCDESALENRTQREKKKYSRILLSFAERQSDLSRGLAFGESNTEKRIKNILLEKKRSAWVHFLLLVFVSICTYSFLTVPQRTQQETNAELPSKLPVKEDYALEDMPVPMQEVILSDTSVLSDGVPFRVQLVMAEGEYFTEEYAGAGEVTLAYPEGIVSAGLEFSKRFEYAEPGFVTYIQQRKCGIQQGRLCLG